MNYMLKRLMELSDSLNMEVEDYKEIASRDFKIRHVRLFRHNGRSGDIICRIEMIDAYTYELDFELDCMKAMQALRDYASWE